MEPHACSGSDGFMLLSRYRRAVMGTAALWILFFHAGYIHFAACSRRGGGAAFLAE